MSGEEHKTLGVVGVLIGADGYVWAEATDFSQSHPSGFTLREAQELRVRRRLACDLIKNSCGDLVAKAILASEYRAQEIVRELERNHGIRERMIPVGHEEPDA